MSAAALIADLRERGVQLDIGDCGLVCRARRGVLTSELKAAIRENKAYIERVLATERPKIIASRWGDLAPIVEWFLVAEPPAEVFKLKQGVTIADPARWWRAIAADIAVSPEGPRARYGALQDDLWRAYSIFGRNPVPTTTQ